MKTTDRKNNITMCCQMANLLSEIYATKDVIAEADAEIVNLQQPAAMTAVCYSEVLLENEFRKSLRCSRIGDKSRLKRIVLESPNLSIRYSMCNYWGEHKEVTLQCLQKYVTFLVELQEDSHIPT